MTPDESTAAAPTSVKPRPPLGPLLFCAALLLVGCIFLGIVVWRSTHRQEADAPPPARDMAAEAKELIRQSKPAPLSGPLAKILADAETTHIASAPHPLIGKPAPEFTRPEVSGEQWSLKNALAKGPVVLIVYLGYHCNHCVSELFDVNEDYKYFRELGAEVVAVSPDTPRQTQEKYARYGPFAFPVLSDRDNSIAEAYGVYTPAKDGKPDDLNHGTFVIDRTGTVRWAATGTFPFSDTKTLLYELAKLTGREKAK